MTDLNQVIGEYTDAIIGPSSNHPSQDGIHTLTTIVDNSVGQINEISTILDSTQRDTIVLQEALLPQLNANTQHLLKMFQTIDELGALVDKMERSARTCRDQVKQVQNGYDTRHPKQVERFFGSFNMFRKKNTGQVGKPDMPTLAPLDIPNTKEEIEKIQQNILQ